MSDTNFHEQILEHHARRGDWYPVIERLKMMSARRSPEAFANLVKDVVSYADTCTLRPFLDIIISTEKDATFIETVPKRIVSEGYLRQMAEGNYSVYDKEWLNDATSIKNEYQKYFTADGLQVLEQFISKAKEHPEDFRVLVFPFSSSALEMVCVPKNAG